MMSETLWRSCARTSGLTITSSSTLKPNHVCRKRKQLFIQPADWPGSRLIWKDLPATFGTRLAEAGCDAFTIAQLLGHSDVRVTMRYVRMVEDSKRVAVEAVKLTFGKVGHVLATWPKQPPLPAAVNG